MDGWPWMQAAGFHEAAQHPGLPPLVHCGPTAFLGLRLRWPQSSQSGVHIVSLALLNNGYSYVMSHREPESLFAEVSENTN